MAVRVTVLMAESKTTASSSTGVRRTVLTVRGALSVQALPDQHVFVQELTSFRDRVQDTYALD